MKSKIVILLCVLGLSSCAYYGGHRQYTHSTSLVQFLYPKGDIPMTDKKYPVLNLPLKVGLAFIPDQNNSTVISLATKNNLLGACPRTETYCRKAGFMRIFHDTYRFAACVKFFFIRIFGAISH